MAGSLQGKVAFITGAARGQGRAHAVKMAEQGADIIAVDLCGQIASNPYPLSTLEDLAETVQQVEALDRRIVSVQADVRNREALADAVSQGIATLGRLDIVVANAGILPAGSTNAMDFIDAVDVDLVGVMNAVAVAMPHLPDGASIVITGSTAGLMPATTGEMGPGGDGYAWSKKILVEYTEHLALHLAARFIRVNCIHPTNVNTHLLHNEYVYSAFRPDLEHPTREDVLPAFTHFQGMPIPYVEPSDIANLAAFLCSEDARYITGQQIRVDAAALLKFPNGPS